MNISRSTRPQSGWAGCWPGERLSSLGGGCGLVQRPGWGGGGALEEVPKTKTTDLCYHSPLSLPLLVYSPLFSRYQMTAYCYYRCYCGLPPVDIIFSCPDTITLITVANTLIIANSGCFTWASQGNNYSPNRKCPSDSPPSESSWVCDSPLFSSLQPQLRESVLQWVPKTRVSAPPPPQGATSSDVTRTVGTQGQIRSQSSAGGGGGCGESNTAILSI